MGLSRDGVENLSAVMDRDYNEPRRPKSRDHSRRNSHDKNHRTSGERGLNGSRPVPVEKPLTLIINRNDNFENGHYSNSKSSYNHLLEKEFTKNALDVVHGHSSCSTPASSVANSGPSTSSSVHNVSFTSPPRLGNRQEEVIKRRNIVEKIDRLRDASKIETFVAQLDGSTSNQISMNVRRFARQEHPNFPEKIRNFILEGFDSPVATNKVKHNALPSSKNLRLEEDGDATDYEDLKEETEDAPPESVSPSTAQWMVERSQFVVMDTRIADAIETTQKRIAELVNRLESLESVDGGKMKGEEESGDGKEEETCARLIPWDGSKRRKLMRMKEYLLNELPSTSRETAALNPSAFSQQAMQYLHRAAIMASFHIRKNKRKSIWQNSRELEEEKSRNGVKKKEERDRREKRKLERCEKEEEDEEKSDEYEVTDDDDDDDEMMMPTPNHSRRANGAPKEKRRKKDTERKTSRKEMNKNRRSSDCPISASRLSSVASRPSLDGELDFPTPSFNHSTWLEGFKCQMPTNFTYNKIPVPECKRVHIEDVAIDSIEDASAYSTESMLKKMAIAHHQLEHEERIRFTTHPRGLVRPRGQRGTSREQRETSQDSGESRSTPSNRGPSEEAEGVETETVPSLPTPLPLSVPPPVPPPVPSRARGAPPRPPLPHFDFNSIRPVSDYERLSIEPPYEKRQFSR